MCGRFTQSADSKKIAKEFEVSEVPAVEARYNIAPTQEVLAVLEREGEREATFFKWGLVPSWAKDVSMGARLINARSETVAEKPAFRVAFKKRRCIIPADGFYEWRSDGGRKQPFFFRMQDERLFGFAGLWEHWEGEGGEVVNSCAILTTEANEVLRPVHERMPVIIHPDDYKLWLSAGERELDLVKEMLRPYTADEMTGYPVSTSINSPRSQGAKLVERAATRPA